MFSPITISLGRLPFDGSRPETALSPAQKATYVLALKGDAGPEGPAGPPGPAQMTYTHVQSSPSANWIINHNFGTNPIIEVLNPGGQAVVAEIVHTSLNQVHVYLNTPMTGTAIAR